jgi:hypothetical protein
VEGLGRRVQQGAGEDQVDAAPLRPGQPLLDLLRDLLTGLQPVLEQPAQVAHQVLVEGGVALEQGRGVAVVGGTAQAQDVRHLQPQVADALAERHVVQQGAAEQDGVEAAGAGAGEHVDHDLVVAGVAQQGPVHPVAGLARPGVGRPAQLLDLLAGAAHPDGQADPAAHGHGQPQLPGLGRPGGAGDARLAHVGPLRLGSRRVRRGRQATVPGSASRICAMATDGEPGGARSLRLLGGNRPFRLLWTARTVSFLGDSLSLVALLLHVAETTGQALAVAWLLLAGDFAPALLGPLAGTVADRLDRKRVMVGCELAQRPWWRRSPCGCRRCRC